MSRGVNWLYPTADDDRDVRRLNKRFQIVLHKNISAYYHSTLQRWRNFAGPGNLVGKHTNFSNSATDPEADSHPPTSYMEANWETLTGYGPDHCTGGVFIHSADPLGPATRTMVNGCPALRMQSEDYLDWLCGREDGSGISDLLDGPCYMAQKLFNAGDITGLVINDGGTFSSASIYSGACTPELAWQSAGGWEKLWLSMVTAIMTRICNPRGIKWIVNQGSARAVIHTLAEPYGDGVTYGDDFPGTPAHTWEAIMSLTSGMYSEGLMQYQGAFTNWANINNPPNVWDGSIKRSLRKIRWSLQNNKIILQVEAWGRIAFSINNASGSTVTYKKLGTRFYIKCGAVDKYASPYDLTNPSYETITELIAAINTDFASVNVTAVLTHGATPVQDGLMSEALDTVATDTTVANGAIRDVNLMSAPRRAALSTWAAMHLAGPTTTNEMHLALGAMANADGPWDSDIFDVRNYIGNPVAMPAPYTDIWNQVPNQADPAVNYRLFENGVTLLNWSASPITIDISDVCGEAAWYSLRDNHIVVGWPWTSSTSVTLPAHSGDICLYAAPVL
jgi:hypothetical protein